MRIFIGLVEIANIAATYAKGFRALGHETHTVVWRKNRFYPNSQYDIVVDDRVGVTRPGAGLLRKAFNRVKRRGLAFTQFLHTLTTCDVFIFIFGTSFLSDYWDYPILKVLGKHVVSVFLGDDIRYWYSYEQEMRLLGLERGLRPYLEYRKSWPSGSFVTKAKRVRAAERYADLILSQPSTGQLQTRPYMCVNIPLDLSQYRFNVPEREAPLVIHAPSDSRVKGTNHVLAAVEQLTQEGIQFEFRLIENMPNAQVRELLTEADIVVDQLFSQTVATLALESMATGNVTLARYQPEYAHIPPDCPVVNVTAATLADKLREVILNRDLRRQLACAGRPYVEAHHDHMHIAQQILDWLKPGGIQEYDFVPTFFQNEFVMPPELLKEERKRMWEQRMQRLTSLLFSRSSNKD